MFTYPKIQLCVISEELDSAFHLSKNTVLEEIYKDYREKYETVREKIHYCFINLFYGTLTPNGSFSMGMIQKVGTSFNHVGGFQ